jgi:hypothetical protein
VRKDIKLIWTGIICFYADKERGLRSSIGASPGAEYVLAISAGTVRPGGRCRIVDERPPDLDGLAATRRDRPNVAARRDPELRMKVKLVSFFVAIVAALFAYDLLGTVIWDGAFPLEIELANRGEQQIIRVSADVLMQREWATIVQTNPERIELNLKPVSWAEENPFTVRVPCSGTRSGLGRERSYMQFQLLVLRVEYADGTSEFATADIPDGRLQRKMFVEAR